MLGVAYKRDIGDIRESPSLKLIQLFKNKGARVSYNDPYVPSIMISGQTLNSVELTADNLAAADCVVIAADHSCYDINEIIESSQLVYDTRGVSRGMKSNNLVRLGE